GIRHRTNRLVSNRRETGPTRPGSGRFLPGALVFERVCVCRIAGSTICARGRRTSNPMNTPSFFAPPFPAYSSRREFLTRAGHGAGVLAVAALLEQEGLGAKSVVAADADGNYVNPLAPRPAHFPAEAKSVVWLFMNGGPSHVDTWDYKPELERR